MAIRTSGSQWLSERNRAFCASLLVGFHGEGALSSMRRRVAVRARVARSYWGFPFRASGCRTRPATPRDQDRKTVIRTLAPAFSYLVHAVKDLRAACLNATPGACWHFGSERRTNELRGRGGSFWEQRGHGIKALQ